MSGMQTHGMQGDGASGTAVDPRRGARRRPLKAAFVAPLLALALAFSHAAVLANGIEQLRAFVANVKSAEGEFAQVQQGRSGKLTGTSSGAFLFARPGKFIWKTVKPFDQLLQSDGEKLYVWDKDLNQVAVRKLGEALASSPAGIFFGSEDLDKLFEIKPGPSKDGVDWVQLIPKAKDSQFENIAVGFRGAALAGMELRDGLGNATALNFGKLVLNPPLPAERFRFQIPKGADVVQN